MKIKGIEFSEETIVNALEKAGISLEPKFEPIEIHDGCFVVGVTNSGNYVEIKTGHDYNGNHCEQSIGDVDKFIEALQKAKAYIEKLP